MIILHRGGIVERLVVPEPDILVIVHVDDLQVDLRVHIEHLRFVEQAQIQDSLRAYAYIAREQEDGDGDQVGDMCDNCPAVGNPNQAITITVPGDVDQDSLVTASDIIYMVNYVFKGGFKPTPCEGAGDVDCDGVSTSADIIGLVNYTFKSGPPPCEVCEAYGLGWTCP